jgi:hypothetical protein
LIGARWHQQRRNAAYRQEVFEHLLGDVIKAPKPSASVAFIPTIRRKETLAHGHLDHSDDRIDATPTQIDTL